MAASIMSFGVPWPSSASWTRRIASSGQPGAGGGALVEPGADAATAITTDAASTFAAGSGEPGSFVGEPVAVALAGPAASLGRLDSHPPAASSNAPTTMANAMRRRDRSAREP